MQKIILTILLTLLITCQVAFANLKVTMLNVGQGDALLIQTSEQKILIDTSDVDERDKLRQELYKAGAFRLDKIILTHPHADHIGNCAWLIQNGVFKVKSIYDNGIVSSSRYYRNYIAESVNRNVPHYTLQAGDILNLGDGAEFTVLFPTGTRYADLNNTSIVGRLTYGNFSMLFTGDAEVEVEEEITPAVAACTVLKAGHHGSLTSSTLNFVEKVNPEYVFISAGEPTKKRGGNTYGHPHVDALANYLYAGVKKENIFWTWKNGTVTLETDGETWSVNPERKINWIDDYLAENAGIKITVTEL